MIQANNYRIKYKNCKVKQHQGEVNNYVCLNQECRIHCIICSFCKQQKHHGHDVRPVKIFIESIKKGYQIKRENYEERILQIEETRYIFLSKLRQTVEKVAKLFEKTERLIVERFEQIRNQILIKKEKQDQFHNRYRAFVEKSEQNLQFLIKSYIPTNDLPAFKNYQPIEQLGTLISELFTKIDEKMIQPKVYNNKGIQKYEYKLELEEIKSFRLAPTIQKTGKIYQQMDGNTKQTMCFFSIDYLKLDSLKKLKLTIKQVTKGTIIHLGVITHELYANKLCKQPFSSLNNQAQNLVYYNNRGNSFGHKSKQLGTFSSNSQLTVSLNLQSGLLWIEMNKKKNKYSLPNKLFYLFFSISGFGSVQFDY